MFARIPLIVFAVLSFAAGPAQGQGRWVDAVNGSNANGGTSPTDAWRTITHALGSGTSGTIHVQPGTYDTALGEVFPLVLQQGSLVGEQGPDVTFVASPVDAFSFPNGGTVSVTGFTVTAVDNGADCATTSSLLRTTWRDVKFYGCETAILVSTFNWTCFSLGNELTLERVEITDSVRNGVRMYSEQCSDNLLTMTDCTVRGSGLSGVQIDTPTHAEIYFNADIFRCRFVDNDIGFHVTDNAVDVTPVIEDCLFADNRIGLATHYLARIRRCTLAHNGQVGYRVRNPRDYFNQLTDSVLYGNGDDLLILGTGAFQQVSNNDIGDGDFVGTGGNISEDPFFRDPAQSDFRLGFGTGCIDALPPGGTDLTGFARTNDGDLDLLGGRDMGAIELRTLEMPATLAIGTKLHVDYHAEIGSFGALYLARTSQLPAPLATPFGLQWLPPGFLELVGMQKSLTPEPMRRTIFIPNSPALVGQEFSFQALSRSSNAPMGAAWTDAATVTFTL